MSCQACLDRHPPFALRLISSHLRGWAWTVEFDDTGHAFRFVSSLFLFFLIRADEKPALSNSMHWVAGHTTALDICV